MRLPVVLAVLVSLLAGCATAYHPAGLDGGYGETRLGTNVFRVTFTGNAASTQAATDEMALLRAAEVSLANGCRWFISSGTVPTGKAVSLATNVVPVPASTLTITCYATRPETAAVVFDADELTRTLGAKYDRR